MEDQTLRDSQTTKAFQKLLWAFIELPKTARGRTVMEVSGYPHYENVASNILAFYFDPSAEHGLKDLFYASFLKMAGYQDESQPSEINIARESDAEGGRIDLVLESDAYFIAIENKIFHWLANDLEQYARTITKKAKDRTEIRAVLGLNPIASKQLKGGFVSFTYDQLWQQVQDSLGRYLPLADPKWVTYLIDFMVTTTNLAGRNMELSKTDHFFVEHHELIDTLFAEHKTFCERLKQRLQPLCDIMSQKSEPALCNQVWVCRACSCLVLDFLFENTYRIACDVTIHASGWTMTLFHRPPPGHVEYLRKLVVQPALADKVGKYPAENGRYVLQKWAFDTDYENICDDLSAWIKIIVDASKTLSLQNPCSLQDGLQQSIKV